MGSLVDELRDDRPPSGRRCYTCDFLAEREDKAEWDAAFADKSITISSLHRAMVKRGFQYTDSGVSHHRRAGHAG